MCRCGGRVRAEVVMGRPSHRAARPPWDSPIFRGGGCRPRMVGSAASRPSDEPPRWRRGPSADAVWPGGTARARASRTLAPVSSPGGRLKPPTGPTVRAAEYTTGRAGGGPGSRRRGPAAGGGGHREVRVKLGWIGLARLPCSAGPDRRGVAQATAVKRPARAPTRRPWRPRVRLAARRRAPPLRPAPGRCRTRRHPGG